MNTQKDCNGTLKPLTIEALRKCRILFKKCVAILIDETSMLNPIMVSHIDTRLKQILDCNQDFGGLTIYCFSATFFNYPL